MRIKSFVTLALLLFVGTSVVAMVARTMREAAECRPLAGRMLQNEVRGGELNPSATVSSATPVVMAYYFHRKARCGKCETIEAYAREAIGEGFAKELQSGRLQWRVLDYEEPQNGSLARQYEVIAPTVVLVRLEGGKEARWENFSEVWALTGDKAGFLEYIRMNVHDFLTGTGGETKPAG